MENTGAESASRFRSPPYSTRCDSCYQRLRLRRRCHGKELDTRPKPCDFQSSDKFPRTVSRTKSFQRLRVLNPPGKTGPVYNPRCSVSTLHSPGRYMTPHLCPFTLHTCPIHYTPLYFILSHSRFGDERHDSLLLRHCHARRLLASIFA